MGGEPVTGRLDHMSCSHMFSWLLPRSFQVHRFLAVLWQLDRPVAMGPDRCSHRGRDKQNAADRRKKERERGREREREREREGLG